MADDDDTDTTDTGADLPSPARTYPSARSGDVPPPAPLNIGYADWLAEGGYPDHSESGVKFAAAQRAQARQTENRAAVTSGRPNPTGESLSPAAAPGAVAATAPFLPTAGLPAQPPVDPTVRDDPAPRQAGPGGDSRRRRR